MNTTTTDKTGWTADNITDWDKFDDVDEALASLVRSEVYSAEGYRKAITRAFDINGVPRDMRRVLRDYFTTDGSYWSNYDYHR